MEIIRAEHYIKIYKHRTAKNFKKSIDKQIFLCYNKKRAQQEMVC